MSEHARAKTEAEIKYAHIIDLLHHVSKKHLPMPLAGRAAQFSPFAALTGLDEAIEETSAERIAGYDP